MTRARDVANLQSGAIINEAGADLDFRIESDDNANMFFVDGGNDKIGIGGTPTAGTFHIFGTSTTDQVIIENTNTGGSSAPDLVLFRKSTSSAADNDVLGRLDFRGLNDANEEINYATIFSTIADASDGTENGKLTIQQRIGSSYVETFTLDENGNMEISSSSDPKIRINNSSTSLSANTSIGSLEFKTNDASSGGTGIGASIEAKADGNFGSDQQGLYLAFSTRDSGSGETNTERVRIDSSGKVGIGATAPGYDLEVRSNDTSTEPQVVVRNLGTGDAAIGFQIASANNYYIGVDNSDSDKLMLGRGLAVGTTPALVIDTSSNVGIGTTSPGATLQVDDGSGRNLQIAPSGSGIDIISTTNPMRLITSDASNMTFSTNGSSNEAMRIDTSQNLMVARTSLGIANTGHTLAADGYAEFTRNASSTSVGASVNIGRNTSDGKFIDFFIDGVSKGFISYRGAELQIGQGNVCLQFSNGSDVIVPANESGTANDDAVDLGLSNARFDDIFATNGTIQTSDEKEKNTIVDSDLGLDFIKRLSPKSYKFNNKTRTHYGLIAQDVETVLSDISKSNTDFAGLIKSDISENQDGSNYRYGLRYTELIAPMIKALQEANEKIEALEAKVAKLEG